MGEISEDQPLRRHPPPSRARAEGETVTTVSEWPPNVQIIDDLMLALHETHDVEYAEKWWRAIQKIDETALPAQCHRHLVQAQSMISAAIAEVRGKYPSQPSIGRASVALAALRSAIRRETTGLDGWPSKS